MSISLGVATSSARPVPQNLANGLDKIVESYLSGITPPNVANLERHALVDPVTGNYLVDIMPDGQVPVATLRANLESNFPLLQVTSVDTSYAGHGIIEGYPSVVDAAGIAQTVGVGSVILQLRPITNVGAVTAQGVNQHRVNQISTIYNACRRRQIMMARASQSVCFLIAIILQARQLPGPS